MSKLILYSKHGCHLCEGLQEKLEQIENINFQLEVRDITSREDWFAAYQYEVPVLTFDPDGPEQQLPRPSPRATVQQVERMLQKYLPTESKDKVRPKELNPFAARYREGVVGNIEGVEK